MFLLIQTVKTFEEKKIYIFWPKKKGKYSQKYICVMSLEKFKLLNSSEYLFLINIVSENDTLL
jgi:hypothetical protein